MNPLSIPLREQLINKKLNHFLTKLLIQMLLGFLDETEKLSLID